MMLARPLIMTGILGAAVGGPIIATKAPDMLPAWPAASQKAGPVSHATDAWGNPASPIGPNSDLYSSPAPLEGMPNVSLAQVLRMDITKDWVYRNWARKSTGLADPDLFGIRVPVVTGTQMTDVAGAVSYYFNANGRADRIRLRGRTADTTEIVRLAQSYYGMQFRQGAPGEQLLQTAEGNRVLSELRTRPEPVLWSTEPHSSFLIEMEINRPGAGRFVERPLPPVEEQTAAEEAAGAAETAPQSVSEETIAEIGKPEGEVVDVAQDVQPGRLQDFRWPN